MCDLMQAAPTGEFAITAGTRIVIGVVVDGRDLDIGTGIVSALDSRTFKAIGTYAFTYKGASYLGTWATSVSSTDGEHWELAEEFTGTICHKDAFSAKC